MLGAVASASGDQVEFSPVSLTTLVDSPLIAGQHFRRVDLAPGAKVLTSLGRDTFFTLTGNITEVANGNLNAGNAGMVAAILQGTATGNVNATANGSINARFGIDAENFGRGTTSVTTLGPVVGAHAGPGTIGFFWYDDV